MKLDPVYLVAPKPTPPSMPTRRACMIAGATFTFGLLTGGACGYSLGAASGSAPVDDELPPSGDAELDELRRLAVKAPLSELADHILDFCYRIGKDYRRDEILWRGHGRLCEAVLGDPAFPDRRISARLLAQIVEYADPDYRERFRDRATDLRAIK